MLIDFQPFRLRQQAVASRGVMLRLRGLSWPLAMLFGAASPAAVVAQEVAASAPPVSAASEARQAAQRDLTQALGVIAANPADLFALTQAGRAALTLGDARTAISFLARAEALAPRDPVIKAAMGAALVRLEDPQTAMRYFESAISLGGLERAYMADRGLAFDLLGDQRRAQADYDVAARTHPSDELTRRHAISLGISGQADAAVQMLGPLLRAQDRAAWRSRAMILAMNGRADEARQIARATMPQQLADGLEPYFGLMDRLTPGQLAAASHFGHFPSYDVLQSQPSRMAAVAPPSSAPAPTPAPAARGARSRRTVAASRTARREEAGVGAIRAPRRTVIAAAATPPPPVALANPATMPPVAEAPPPAPPAPVVIPAPAVQSVSSPSASQPPAPAPAAALPEAAVPASTPVEPAPSAPLPAPVVIASVAVPPSRPYGPVDLAPSGVSVERPADAQDERAPLLSDVAVVPASGAPSPQAGGDAATGPASEPIGAAESADSAAPAAPADDVRLSGWSLDAMVASIDVPAAEQAASSGGLGADELAAVFADQRARQAEAAAAARQAARDTARQQEEARRRAEADAAARAEAERLRRNPARIWVQVATGADVTALGFDCRRLARQHSASFEGQSCASAAWNRTRRLVVGPFRNAAAARAWLSAYSAAGGDGFVWNSDAGEEVAPISRGR